MRISVAGAALLVAAVGTHGMSQVQAPLSDAAKASADLRLQALQFKPSDIGVKPRRGAVYGVIVDLAYPEAVATLVAFSTGDASIYISSGGGVIGGGGHADVRAAASNLIKAANKSKAAFRASNDSSLPKADFARITLLTPEGRRTAVASMEALSNESHPFFRTFDAAHGVITPLMQRSER